MQATENGASAKGPALRVIALCLLVAIFEGVDIQSVGVATSGIAQQFSLGPASLGLVMSASILGLMAGAALGGAASDRLGRKPVLIVSMLLLGLFSLATIVAPDFAPLILFRFLAGLGLGGAFPNMIALISETVTERWRGVGMGIMYAGMPAGGAIAATLMSRRPPSDWAAVFHLGGWGPLLLVPLLAFILPRRTAPALMPVSATASKGTDAGGQMFGAPAARTFLLWLSFFFTLLVVYALLNWLPALLVAKGFERSDALHMSMAMNVGAAIGGLATGYCLDRWTLTKVVATAYAGMIGSLAALAFSAGSAVYAAAFAVGFFVIGGQLLLYATAPRLYSAALRGRGVGAAISVGRAGSVVGPLLAGAMLSIGISASIVPLLLASGLVIALFSALAVARD